MLGLCVVLRTPAVAGVPLIDRKAVAHEAEVVWPHDLMEAWEQEWTLGLIKRLPDFLGSRMCWMSIQFSPVSGLAPRLLPFLLGGPEVWEPCCYVISQDYGMQMLRQWTGDDALPPQNFWQLRSGGIYLSTGMHASYLSFYEVPISGGALLL